VLISTAQLTMGQSGVINELQCQGGTSIGAQVVRYVSAYALRASADTRHLVALCRQTWLAMKVRRIRPGFNAPG
jgi:hypothetical protein